MAGCEHLASRRLWTGSSEQAIHQVLEPMFDPEFSESSYGFRKGRNAQMFVERARSYIEEGRRWVVDVDLEKFFDRVNDDILMARVARKVKDKRLVRLIRRYLQAGIMVDGLATTRPRGHAAGESALALAVEHHAR